MVCILCIRILNLLATKLDLQVHKGIPIPLHGASSCAPFGTDGGGGWGLPLDNQ